MGKVPIVQFNRFLQLRLILSYITIRNMTAVQQVR